MGRKLKFILSDLHLGAGYAHAGGNNLEDFLADEALVQFLHEVLRESRQTQREVELIINGDFLEFLQVPAVDQYDLVPTAYPPDLYLDTSEKASIKRLNLIIQGHPNIFDALTDFLHVEQPQRRITIIKGNHDVTLFWPGVKGRLREILGASGSRASLLLFADEFVCREKIYIEHGHQRAESWHRYQDFFNPRSTANLQQLHYPPGSRIMVNVFNNLERDHWFVDHLKPLSAFIWYALRWNFDLAAVALAGFIRHTAPGHDSILDEILSPTVTLLRDLEDADRRRQLAQRYGNEAAFRQQFHQQIQPYLRITEGDLPPVGADPLALGQADQQQQHHLLRQAAAEVAERENARVVLFGHTHVPAQETLPDGRVYINTGSWIADFSQASPETWQALFSGSLRLKDIPPCWPYARIDYDETGSPAAQMLYFGQEITPPVEPKVEAVNFFTRLTRWLRPTPDQPSVTKK